MSYPTEDKFPDYQNSNWQDLVEKFLEKNPKIKESFDEFSWNEFEKHRQNYDDYIAEGQIEDKLMEKQ
jgi:hypothetical protein